MSIPAHRPSLPLTLVDVHRALCDGLAEAEAAIELEQAVRGLDSTGEIVLQDRCAEALLRAGFGVHREVRYPGDRVRPRRNQGWRCDLVVTPAGLPLDEDAAMPSVLPLLGLPAFRPPDRCPLDEALWIEVKRVAQFGPERPRAGYGAALQGPIWRDLERLGTDEAVAHAAQLVILFTASAEIARHDLSVSLDRAWSRGLRLDAPLLDDFAINDRLGNACCTVALVRIAR